MALTLIGETRVHTCLPEVVITSLMALSITFQTGTGLDQPFFVELCGFTWLPCGKVKRSSQM